jgi:hypothetical protein
MSLELKPPFLIYVYDVILYLNMPLRWSGRSSSFCNFSTFYGHGQWRRYYTVAVRKTIDPSIVQLLATDHAEGPLLRLADPNSTFPTSLK